MHTLAEVWATKAEYLPGEQLLHCESAVAPWALEYFPLPHVLHPFPEPDPAAICPVWSPYLPATQTIHVALPVSPWYLPSTQSAHDPATFWLTSGLALPASHAMQLLDAICAS